MEFNESVNGERVALMTEAEYKKLANTVSTEYLRGGYNVEFPAAEGRAYFEIETKKIIVGQEFLQKIYQERQMGKELPFPEFVKFVLSHEFGHFFDLYFSKNDKPVEEKLVESVTQENIGNPIWISLSSETKKQIIYKIINFLDDPWTNTLYSAKNSSTAPKALEEIYTKGLFSDKDLSKESRFLQTGYYYLLAATLQTSDIPYTFSPEVIKGDDWYQFSQLKTTQNQWNTTEKRKSTLSYRNVVLKLIELLTDEDIKQLQNNGVKGQVHHFLPGEMTDELTKDIQAAIEVKAEQEKNAAQHIARLNQAKTETAELARTLEAKIQELLEGEVQNFEIEPKRRQNVGNITSNSLEALKLGIENPFSRKRPELKKDEAIIPFDLAVLTDDSSSVSEYSNLVYQALALISNVFSSLRNKTPNSQLFFASVGGKVSEFVSSPEKALLGFQQGTEAFYQAFIDSQSVMSDAQSKFPGEKRKQIVLVITDGQFTGTDVDKIPKTLQSMKDRDDIIVLPIPVNLSLIQDFAKNFESLGVPTPSSENIDIKYIAEYIKALVQNVISQKTT